MVTDYVPLMCLIHVVHSKVYKSTDEPFMLMYKTMKFKMKMAYEAWIRNISYQTLIHHAILKTLQ